MIVDYLRQQILLCILSSLLSYLDAFRPLSLNQIYTMVWKWILQKHLDNLYNQNRKVLSIDQPYTEAYLYIRAVMSLEAIELAQVYFRHIEIYDDIFIISAGFGMPDWRCSNEIRWFYLHAFYKISFVNRHFQSKKF